MHAMRNQRPLSRTDQQHMATVFGDQKDVKGPSVSGKLSNGGSDNLGGKKLNLQVLNSEGRRQKLNPLQIQEP